MAVLPGIWKYSDEKKDFKNTACSHHTVFSISNNVYIQTSDCS